MAKIKITADGFLALSAADIGEANRETARFLGKWWHRTLKAIKFTKRGATLYKYAPRSGDPGSGRKFKGSYSQRKLLKGVNGKGERSIGEVKPNVWSGRSRAAAMASRKVEATGTSRKGRTTIIFSAPALNFAKLRDGSSPREEVTRTAPQEYAVMSKISAKQFEKQVSKIRRRKTIKG